MSLAQIKKELEHLPQPELVQLLLRTAKFKKENKELLFYLLFESNDVDGFILQCKKEITKQFKEVNKTHVYYAKKSIRKVLRWVNKQIKFSNQPVVTIELLLHFIHELKQLNSLLEQSNQLLHVYLNQYKKVKLTIAKLHEDLQYDYTKLLEKLTV
ncbi:MAG: hypothetical protein ACK5UI_08620 [Bacteroidota bacterium]